MSEPIKEYYSNGSIYSERWCINGKYHRTDGPAIIYYNKDGSISSERWYVNGKIHRTDGPAIIYYNKDGSTYGEHWCINGKGLTEEEFKEYKWNLEFDKELTKELLNE